MNNIPLPLVLCILDGWGESHGHPFNAIAEAKTPFWDKALKQYASTHLQASESFVGLPKGQMGNSEVGHMTIGTGRVIDQDLVRIDKAVANDSIRANPKVQEFVKKMQITQGNVHIFGLMSDGGVHSHIKHFQHMAEFFAHAGCRVFIHAALDGRDTPPQSAASFVQEFEENVISHNPLVHWGSLSGRFYAMDRDQRWERTRKAYDAIRFAQAPRFQNAAAYIKGSYESKISDEFVEPAVHANYVGVQPHDGLVVINFRADRVRQLLRSFGSSDFTAFERGEAFHGPILGMTHYAEDIDLFAGAIFDTQTFPNSLGDIFQQHRLRQLRIAETEKYAHVTFFFNAGREEPFALEERILIPSPKVKTYDLKPEMSAQDITDAVVSRLEKAQDDIVILNFANPDMVGHTGNLAATIQAIECVDRCLAQIAEAVLAQQGTLIVTADHGNAETMQDPETHQPHTAHTCNSVPFLIIADTHYDLRSSGTLADIAPTILDILGIEKPVEMSGKSLLDKP